MPHEAQNPALPLPFADLSAKGFEQFVAAFLATQPTWEILETQIKESASARRSKKRSVAMPHRIIDSASYAGASGLKQDGIDLVATTDSGARWAFQCKHVAGFGPAKATAAMDKAEAEFSSADRYFLLLSREPSAATVKRVAERPRWELWGAEKLSLRFFNTVPRDLQPGVLRQIFGDAAGRIIDTLYPLGDGLLQSPSAFFALWLEERRIFHHRSDLVGRDADLARLHAFVDSPRERVCILPAPGGRGKSRLLRAFADAFATRHPTRKLWFVNPNAAPDADARHDALRTTARGELVIVQDDAHRTESVRRDLLARLAHPEVEGKILLAARPQAVAALTALAQRAGFDSEAIVTLPTLSKLTKRQLKTLAAARLDPPHRGHADFLAGRAGDCPLIVTVGAELINRGRVVPDALLSSADFYREVFARFEEDEFARLGGDVSALREILQCLALLAPWQEADDGLDTLAAFLGRTPGELRDRLERLRAAGLLVSSTKGLRPAPDLYADFLAFHACYDGGRLTAFARRLQTAYATTAGPEMLRNLSEAEWQAAQTHEQAESLLEPFWRRLLAEFKAATFWDRAQIVKRWAAFGVYQPARSLDLARLALDDTEAAPPSAEERGYALSLHTHAQVLSELPALLEPIAIYHDEHRAEALDLLWDLHFLWHPAKADAEQAALNVISRVAAFKERHPISAPLGVLVWLDNLLRSPRGQPLLESRDGALATLMKPLFSRFVDISYSEGRSFHFGHAIASEEQTRPIRDHALRILREVVIPRSEIAALNSLPVLEDATAEDQLAMGASFTTAQLRPWQPERLKALEALGQILDRYPTARVHFRVRQILRRLTRKRGRSRFDTRVNALLTKISDRADLRWHRVVCSRADEEFLDYENTPERDFHASFEKAKAQWAALTQTVAGELCAAYPEGARLVGELEARMRDHQLHGEAPVLYVLLEMIGARQPDGGRALVEDILRRATSPLDGVWHNLLGSRVWFPDDQLLAWSEAVLASDNLPRQQALLNLFASYKTDTIPARLLTSAQAWARNARGERVDTIIRHLRWSQGENDALWSILVTGLDLAALSSAQLHNLIEVLGHAVRYGDAQLPSAFIPRLLDALESLDQLDGRRAADLIRHLADHQPRAIYDLFWKRIARRSSARAISSTYLALPWAVRWPLPKLAAEPDNEALIRTLLGKVKTAPDAERGDWTTLFQWITPANPQLCLRLLREWASEVSDKEALRRLLLCLRDEDSPFIFEQTEFVRLLLRAARRLDPTEIAAWNHRIAAISAPRIRGFTGGELDPEHRHFGEAAAQALSRHADDPELRAFYASIVENEKRDAAFHRQRAAESDAELDED